VEIKLGTFAAVTHGVESADNFKVELARRKEVRSRFRGRFPYVFDRGNELKTISFDMAKEFDSYPKAVAWMLDVSDKLPREPLLATITEWNGTEVMVRRFKLAQIPQLTMLQMGCTVLHNYRLIGTEITKPTPTAT
jgi:hypothetical protein